MERKIIKSIAEYAKSYEKLNDLQLKNRQLIPIGDQKTGAIGEFIGKKILTELYPNLEIKFAENHSQKGYDIELIGNNLTKYYQIKTVSEYSKTLRTSKIKTSFIIENKEEKLNGILFIYVDKSLISGEYILIEENIPCYEKKSVSFKILKNNNPSKKYNYGENL